MGCGCIGEIFLTIFTFIWIFWPVAVVAVFATTLYYYYIPSGVISMIFLISA